MFNESNCLDDRLVLSVNIELDVMSGEGVGQPEFGFVHLKIFLLDEGWEMSTETSEKLENHVISGAFHLHGRSDHTCQILVLHSQSVRFFLFDVS